MAHKQPVTLSPDDNEFYSMSGDKKGICVIINLKTFTPPYSNREGAEKDEERLKILFEKLGFDVQLFTDISQFSVQIIINYFGTLVDHTASKAFILIIMSHGREGTIIASDGLSIPVDNIIQPFVSCGSLDGKPKIFIIQACQGEAFMQSGTSYKADAAYANTSGMPSFNSARGFCTVPTSADCLIASSTVEGYVSHRSTEEGSVFICVLVEELKKSVPGESFVDILTRVNFIIAGMEFDNGHKQMTCFKSTLRKKIALATK